MDEQDVQDKPDAQDGWPLAWTRIILSILFIHVKSSSCHTRQLMVSPNEERTQVTFAPASYFGILGATADSFSLVAGRMPPLPAQWDRFLLWFGVP